MPIKAPARIYTAMEGRAAFEYLAWSASRRFLSMLPKGDGHVDDMREDYPSKSRVTISSVSLLVVGAVRMRVSASRIMSCRSAS